MSAEFARKGEKPRRLYTFSDAKCIEASCWAPGMYQRRGATMSGSRNTGSPDDPTCMNRAYHGCPRDRGHDPEKAKARTAEGWKCMRSW
jgi:hypothetical protein